MSSKVLGETTPLPREAESRGADFREYESHPITLIGGEDWHFRKPRIRYLRDGQNRKGVRIRALMGDRFDESLTDLIRALESPFDESGDQPVYVRTLMDIAFLLLTANYDLTDEQFDELVQIEPGEPLMSDLQDLIYGRTGKKTSPATSG